MRICSCCPPELLSIWSLPRLVARQRTRSQRIRSTARSGLHVGNPLLLKGIHSPCWVGADLRGGSKYKECGDCHAEQDETAQFHELGEVFRFLGVFRIRNMDGCPRRVSGSRWFALKTWPRLEISLQKRRIRVPEFVSELPGLNTALLLSRCPKWGTGRSSQCTGSNSLPSRRCRLENQVSPSNQSFPRARETCLWIVVGGLNVGHRDSRTGSNVAPQRR